MGVRGEAPPEDAVLRRLEEGGGEPHDRQQDETEQGQREGTPSGGLTTSATAVPASRSIGGPTTRPVRREWAREYSAKPPLPTLAKSG